MVTGRAGAMRCARRHGKRKEEERVGWASEEKGEGGGPRMGMGDGLRERFGPGE
jgi:hypothetical protein